MNDPDEPIFSSRRNPENQEADFSDPFSSDPDSLEHNDVYIRSLMASDANALKRIDRKATGKDRAGYIQQKINEAINHTGVRISLVAEDDGMVVGFIMARLDHGEFGRTFSMAVIDNIGVDPGYHGVGQALMRQLIANLGSLRVDGIRTIARWDDHEINRFLSHNGFSPSQRIALRCPL